MGTDDNERECLEQELLELSRIVEPAIDVHDGRRLVYVDGHLCLDTVSVCERIPDGVTPIKVVDRPDCLVLETPRIN